MNKPDRLVYLDHAATTPVHPAVVESMLPYFAEQFGNPSSIYSIARSSRQALDRAREVVADALGAKPEEVVFTSGGSESDNLAIKGVALSSRTKGNHIITSPIEHHAVGHTCEWLKKQGFEITEVPSIVDGVVNPDDVARAIKEQTVLVTIMHANNEVGVIEPIAEIGKIAQACNVPFHTDAVQSTGSMAIDVEQLGVDMLSLSAHKFYGPKGVGALYLRKRTQVASLIHGGGQERNRRAGTENVAGIVGLATALRLAMEHQRSESARLTALRDKLIDGVLNSIPASYLTGHPTTRLPNNASFCFEAIEGESILLSLDMMGVAASSGSACTSASLEPSHVLLALGLPHEIAHGSLRLTLGTSTTESDIAYVLSVLPGIIGKLRALSPLSVGTTAIR
ncbi:MAG: cysteine desulfurase NifS [Chloroflexi bacterium]|nr:cysteine desulfurase NifS [Chloroflexota bacterium]